ncbi:hypothetical protein [Microseira sp. BLCC-F43]
MDKYINVNDVPYWCGDIRAKKSRRKRLYPSGGRDAIARLSSSITIPTG